MTEQLTISEVGFRAMADFAALPGNERALSNGKTNSLGESVEHRIIRGLFERLELPELLERVKYGHYTSNITLVAWEVKKQGMKELHQLREHLKATHAEWPYPTVTMSNFSETYWDIVIRDRIERGDFRRAWDDIRKAVKEESPFIVKSDVIERLLRDLIQKMTQKKAIEWKEMHGTHHFRHPTPVHGLSLILELYPRCKWRLHITWAGPHPRFIEKGSYEFEYTEGVIMRLAEHFANERSKKRGKKAARKD